MSQDYLHVSRSIVLGCFMLRFIYIRSILPESLTLLREQLNMLLFKHLIGGKVQQNLETINPSIRQHNHYPKIVKVKTM